ncbi:hypothetical protein [Microlunatus sp. GCM10028923]|uniref:hypothetical protein n=1 Tax=Microlunatus sp. GCM10028923 TaxID=3273400 RepID=UPI0036067C87
MKPRVRITASARKHRISQSRIIAALAEAELVTVDGDAEYYVGFDDRGVELELIVVPDDRHEGRYACIHAMPTHYRKRQEE